MIAMTETDKLKARIKALELALKQMGMCFDIDSEKAACWVCLHASLDAEQEACASCDIPLSRGVPGEIVSDNWEFNMALFAEGDDGDE